jgi:general secretion pathway protein B
MSYILDALRRADADRERERGAVPGLHSRQGAAPDDAALSARAAGVSWPLVILLALVLMLAGAAAVWMLRPAPVAAVSVAAAPSLAPAVAAAQVPAQVPVQVPAQVRPVPSPPAPALRVVAAPSPPPTVLAAPAAAASKPAASAGPVRPIPLAQLSPEQKRDFPALAVGGAIYSESPASRFIIIAGQVVREGELAAPGVTLERIGPKTAVVRWRELQVELPF